MKPTTLTMRANHTALTFDRVYQRAVDPNRVRKIAQSFTPSGLGTITVSKRPDGKLVIVDGQHRVTVVSSIGYEGRLNCQVYEGLSLAEEAQLFLLLNDYKTISPVDRFHAKVIAADPDSVEIRDILGRHGWTVTQTNSTGALASITEVERLYHGGVTKKGPRPDLVDLVIDVITIAWGHDCHGVHNAIIGGLGQLFARYDIKLDSQIKIVDELSKVRPGNLLAKARNLQDSRGGTVNSALAEVVVGMHNKKRRSGRLPEWRWNN